MLDDPLDQPFYWWPRTLLDYPVEFDPSIDRDHLELIRTDTGEAVPFQLSDISTDSVGSHTATLHFFSDLPAGDHREFVLRHSQTPVTHRSQVTEIREGKTIVLNSGAIRVRIPATQPIEDEAPGPIMQVSRSGPNDSWIGSSRFDLAGDRVTRIVARRVAYGPLFISYAVTYHTQNGFRYVATVQCNGGMEFVRLQEDMDGLPPGARGSIRTTWTGFNVTHRQAPNHPVILPHGIRDYDEYPWEAIGEAWPPRAESMDELQLLAGESSTPAFWPPIPGAPPDEELPFCLGLYQAWTAYRIGTFANFWDRRFNDALGIFIDKSEQWQDHEYAYEIASPTLMVRYFYHRGGHLYWEWPLARGRRSTCISFYDHEKDKEAMRQLQQAAIGTKYNGVTYRAGLTFTSYTLFLQNRYGTLDLNCVKDWVLEYPEGARHPPAIFTEGQIKSADELERSIMESAFVSTLPLFGTRQNGGTGPVAGKNVVNFSPVPTRQILKWWIDGFARLSPTMTVRQRTRLTAMFLFMSYVHAGEDYMPLIPMLSGHPNFLSDVKAVPPAMSFLFPDHPMAPVWANIWEKCVALNTRYNTRPAVEEWDADGGRWTENLGTYVFAFLRPALETDFLLRRYDGEERFITPQLADLCEWLVNALSAPFQGETEASMQVLNSLREQGHEWGILGTGQGPRRVYPPQGAHAERRIPPRSLWYLGTCLQRYAPLAAEHAMWAARPTNQDMEVDIGAVDPWNAMYRTPDNHGTRPDLRSRKYTGYGIVLRAALGTPDELSIHLQQIDEGPNYRWGRAAEGGCGVIYFFAAGKAYGFNGQEDVGDRDDEDTSFSTNFGVFKDGTFRAIGQNVLSRPFYDLVIGQFAEIVSRDRPLPYSSPQYISRSVLLAGHDYFVIYDKVLTPTTDHRFSWFVRGGAELPNIQFVRGASSDNPRETQRTNVQTAATTGIWCDGLGDSMAIVSHRKDIQTEATPFGCHVRGDAIDDLVFFYPTPVHFADAGRSFAGTSGLIRRRQGGIEFALFHGTQIECAGFSISTTDTDLGISGSLTADCAPQGEYYAVKLASIKITASSIPANSVFYIDGEAQTAQQQESSLRIELKPGRHHWELTDKPPVPIAPQILRTENHRGGARLFLQPVASATRFRIELSSDDGTTWSKAAEQPTTEIEINGLSDGQKVHVRAIALNAMHESTPGPEYPLYVTSTPPPPPDGLRVELREGMATLTWGEVLGVREYRLYTRQRGEAQFRLLYRGRDCAYQDRHPSIQPAAPAPRHSIPSPDAVFLEYCVTSANGNGEGPKSRIADTDSTSWRNWDPKPGEPFRRVHSYAPDSAPSPADWPRYYPR